MKKIRTVLVGTLLVCMLGLLTACNNNPDNNLNNKKNNNSNGNITTTAAGNKNNTNGVMDDIKEGAEDIGTDMGIDGDKETVTTKK